MLEVRRLRKKPVVVEAVRLMEPATPGEVARWCGGRVCGVGAVGEKVWIEIDTLEGTMRGGYGAWVIKGVKGEFYPCEHDVLEETYDFEPA